jgi:hypothetical protein
MATYPKSFQVLQSVQWRVQNEVLIGCVSPFASFSAAANPSNPSNASDLTRYNTPANPGGTIANAIYIGFPKAFTTSYPIQAAIVPNDDMVEWRSNNRVYDELNCYLRCWFYYKDDWFSMMQTALAVRDQLQTMLLAHAEDPVLPQVTAWKQKNAAKGLPVGWFFDEVLGNDWLCYATTIWIRQEWFLTSLIQP